MEDWQQECFEAAKLCVRNSGFAARNWRDDGDAVYSTTVWAEGKVWGWTPRLWVVPQLRGRSLIVPGFTKSGVWLWGRAETLRAGRADSIRNELANKLKTMRNYLDVWMHMPVPNGAGEKIGPIVEKKFAPWDPRELPHHGRVWQGREPFEYRGISLLEAFDEIVEEEWQRRKLRNMPRVTAARAIASFFQWYKLEWELPAYLAETSRKESQRLWLYEKKPKRPLKGRKRSLISAETIARLKAERKEMRRAKSNIG